MTTESRQQLDVPQLVKEAVVKDAGIAFRLHH